MDKQTIRPVYTQLQGFLYQLPTLKEDYTLSDNSIWEHYRFILKKLSTLTQEDFGEFDVQLERSENGSYLHNSQLRVKIGSLISQLQGKYFPEDAAQLSGTPITSINVTQSQQQSQQQIQKMLVDFSDYLGEKINNTDEPTEKSFLEKLKSLVHTVTSYSQLAVLIAKTAQESGLTVEKLKSIFS